MADYFYSLDQLVVIYVHRPGVPLLMGVHAIRALVDLDEEENQ